MDFNTVTHSDKFLTDLVSLGHSHNHVVHESAVKSVERTVSREICRTGELDLVPLYGDIDGRIDLLAQFAFRAFNLDHIARKELYAHSGWQVYRQFTNS